MTHLKPSTMRIVDNILGTASATLTKTWVDAERSTPLPTIPFLGKAFVVKGYEIVGAEVAFDLEEVVDVRPADLSKPNPDTIPMRLVCPACRELHVDEGEFATKPHHTHACQVCGNVWRPALVPTVGVRFLPGFRNNEELKL